MSSDSGHRISDTGESIRFARGELGVRSGLPESANRYPQSAIRTPVSGLRYPVSTVPRRTDGFTLLEVLMALVIFALAAVMLGSAYVNVLNGYEVAARGLGRDEDVAFARQQVLAEPDRQKVEDGGEFDTADGRRAKWSVEITSTNIADLFNVAFTCEIPNPGRAEPLRVVQNFVVLRPTWSIDAGERGKLKEESKTRILELQGKKNQ
ncbi:MAG: prepilin-type N-terminal cleavage/methylation domain-containing protein [Opitutaceae bacterium]|nr:prepilin-type N-terminal cleavage/methylation domain-containing protein [Opitutaceae bacterium]